MILGRKEILQGQRVRRSGARLTSGGRSHAIVRDRVASGRACMRTFGTVICGAFAKLFILPEWADAAVDSDGRCARLKCISAGIGVLAVAVVFRLYSVQSVQYGKWDSLATKQHTTSMTIEGARGSIIDTDGRALAVSTETLSVGIHPRRIENKDQFARNIAPIIQQPENEVLEKLNQDKNFLWLAKNVPSENRAALLKNNPELLEIVPEFTRFYPQGALGGVILGQVSKEGHGQSGIELSFDPILRAAARAVNMRRDARGRMLRAEEYADSDLMTKVLNMGGEFWQLSPAVALERDDGFRMEGGNVQLTVDSLAQGILEEELKVAHETSKSKRTFGLVMDADTGEILAIGQSPGFDPTDTSVDSPEALRNVVLQNSFEPGSTFKPIISAIALREKVINMNELIDCQNGSIKVGKHTIRDVHPVGIVSAREVLVRSSNVGMIKIGTRLGGEKMKSALQQLQFGRPVGIELPGEARGIMKRADVWKNIDVATTSFGQGISVTALQMVRAYAAIANGGYLVKPTIVKRAAKSDNREEIFPPSVSKQISEALVGVTEDEHGTGHNAAIAGLSVSGKTGTAQKPRANGRGYNPDAILASFIGFVDGTQIGVPRKLVMFVGVDEPHVYPRWGGTLAAPVFRKTIERIFAHLLSQAAKSARAA